MKSVNKNPYNSEVFGDAADVWADEGNQIPDKL